jgi:hypothetical protein
LHPVTRCSGLLAVPGTGAPASAGIGPPFAAVLG